MPPITNDVHHDSATTDLDDLIASWRRSLVAQRMGPTTLSGSTSGDEGCEHVHLALGGGPGEGAAEVPVSRARCLAAAATYSSRPSIGML